MTTPQFICFVLRSSLLKLSLVLCLLVFILFCLQLSSRDNELDNVKDRYNAAVKEVSSTFRVS